MATWWPAKPDRVVFSYHGWMGPTIPTVKIRNGITSPIHRMGQANKWLPPGGVVALMPGLPPQEILLIKLTAIASITIYRTKTTVRQADSGSGEIFTDQTVSKQATGRPQTATRKLNGQLYETKQWIYETTGAKRLTSILVNGVEREAWSYPAPAYGGVRAVKYAGEDGTCTTTEYDASGRPIKQIEAAAPAATVYGVSALEQKARVTTWTYSARPGNLPGYIVTTEVQPDTETIKRTTIETYDGAGRLVHRKLPDLSERFTQYSLDAGTSTVSDYAGNAATGSTLSITYYNGDGSVQSVSGTAVTPAAWTYTTPGSIYQQETTQTTNGQFAESRITDGFGRTASVTAPISLDAGGNAINFTSLYKYDTSGRLSARKIPSPSGADLWEVAGYSHGVDGFTKTTGTSTDETLSEATDSDLRQTLTTNVVDTIVPTLAVGAESVSFAWNITSSFIANPAGGWLAAASTRKSPLSARPVSSWLGHTATAIPLSWSNAGGTVITSAVARSLSGSGLINSVLSTETRTLRNSGQFRKIISRNGLSIAFTSPDAANITLPYNNWKDPLAAMSWESIPHWPKLQIDAATGQVTARLLPNSSTVTESYTYFTASTDHRAGRIRSVTTGGTVSGTTYYHYRPGGQTLATWGSGSSVSNNG